jgi:hypothetical protein
MCIEACWRYFALFTRTPLTILYTSNDSSIESPHVRVLFSTENQVTTAGGDELRTSLDKKKLGD